MCVNLFLRETWNAHSTIPFIDQRLLHYVLSFNDIACLLVSLLNHKTLNTSHQNQILPSWGNTEKWKPDHIYDQVNQNITHGVASLYTYFPGWTFNFNTNCWAHRPWMIHISMVLSALSRVNTYLFLGIIQKVSWYVYEIFLIFDAGPRMYTWYYRRMFPFWWLWDCNF